MFYRYCKLEYHENMIVNNDSWVVDIKNELSSVNLKFLNLQHGTVEALKLRIR